MVALLLSLALAAPSQRLTTASGVRVRAEAKKDAKEVVRLPLGTVVDVVAEPSGEWVQITSPHGNGFVAAAMTAVFDPAKSYRTLADARLAMKELVVEEQKDLVDFLARAAAETKDPTFDYDRVLLLGRVLEAIDIPTQATPGFKRWIQKHDKDVEFSEPAGVWMVTRDRLWTLHAANKTRPFAEALAWAAAKGPRAGECEGQVVCYLWNMNEAEPRYLAEYPSGPHVEDALAGVVDGANGLAECDGCELGKEDVKDAKESIAKMRQAVQKAKGKNVKAALAALDRMQSVFLKRAK